MSKFNDIQSYILKTDELGNSIVLEPSQTIENMGIVVLTNRDGERRKIGIVIYDEATGRLILKKQEAEKDLLRKYRAWTFPKILFEKMDLIYVSTERATYSFERKNVTPHILKVVATKDDTLEDKVAIPIQQMEITMKDPFEQSMVKAMGYDWFEELKDQFQQDYMIRLMKKLKEDRKTYNVLPAPKDVFNAFKYTPFMDVRVCIIGQDPYPNDAAHGLAFSINPDADRPTNPSLKNIFKEMATDVGVVRTRTDLIDLTEQGVMLLNTSLTVCEGEPGSHSKIGWFFFTCEAVKRLSTRHKRFPKLPPVVFVLWGSHAQTMEKYIEPGCPVIKSAHPSPLAGDKFFGTKPFSKINEFVKPKIDWSGEQRNSNAEPVVSRGAGKR